MNIKKQNYITQRIKTLIKENNLTVYRLAKITGINRSTLQKSIEGVRSLNLRQFKELLNVLPISEQEKKFLYQDYMSIIWDETQLSEYKYILNILNNCENMPMTLNLQSMNITQFKSVYTKDEIPDILKELTVQALNKAVENNEIPSFYGYLPLYNDFFNNNIVKYINSHESKINFSLIFELITTSKYGNLTNLEIFNNTLNLMLNTKKNYDLYYIYIEDFHYNNHITIYPYYIIFPEYIVLFDAELTNATIIHSNDIISFMISSHNKKLNIATRLDNRDIDFFEGLEYLYSNEQEEAYIYHISYDPCISSFIPMEIYNEIIDNTFEYKKEVLNFIKSKINNIKKRTKIHALFDKDGIRDFAKTGHVIAYRHPCLKQCNLEQRKIILENILNSIDNKYYIYRAFSSNDINFSKDIEITLYPNQYCINIFSYANITQNNTIKNVNLYEPNICTAIINFIQNVIDTPIVCSHEETKEFIQSVINELDKEIKKSTPPPNFNKVLELPI